jgi:uncharacterized membrane protein
MKKLISYFLQGLLFVVPVVVTFYVVIHGIIWMDNLIPIQVDIPVPGFDTFKLPGMGILVILITITLFGYMGTRFVRNPLFSIFEGVMERTPLLKLIYSSVKDLIEAFVGEKKRFTKPVLVTVNDNPKLQRIGFVTDDDMTEIGLPKDVIAVYLPFSYGFNGQLVVVNAANVTAIDASGTEMMKFVISGGVSDI